MRYCAKCVYPEIAVNLLVDQHGICSSCRTAEEFDKITEDEWSRRQETLQSLVKKIRTSSGDNNYDCVIPVSGGKDSYYQTHTMIEAFGLKPLLVTYHGNNFLPEGDYNRDRMREVFDADHVVWGPSVNVLKKLNLLCFRLMGDMNWQNHCGIFTAPVRLAVNFKIPVIIWGEIAWDLSGMYDPDDFVEFSARVRHEHGLRGYEWKDMVEKSNGLLSEKDMLWAKYPTDDELLDVGVRGLYLGNYFPWNPNAHTDLITRKYDWRPAQQPFERTYRTMSNLDDRYENGVHDLLKFIKFGYGRASDHASKDIRGGYMDRDYGIEMVRKYDHIVSSDLFHWLEYVGLSEDEFWRTADGFRDPRVWSIQDGSWWKKNIWGGESSYGKVHLSATEIDEFNHKRSF